MRRQLAWIFLALAMTGNGCGLEEETVVSEHDRYVTDCVATSQCLTSAGNWEDWAACILDRESDSSPPVAAFDLFFCADMFCFDECQFSASSCDECIEERCSESWAACHGEEWEEYEASEEGSNWRCYRIRYCNSECPAEGDDSVPCLEACYIDSAAEARREYFEMIAHSVVECPQPCLASDASPEACESCMESNFRDAVPACFEEYSSGVNPSGVYSACEGIEDSLLQCLCSTSDYDLCYGL
jgi:hypothetical protein